FKDLYKDPAIITLTDNYRSTEPILLAARSVITQGQERLENVIKDIDKTLTAHRKEERTIVEMHMLQTQTDEYFWIAHQIKELLNQGEDANEIAVIGRNHSELQKILPYLNQASIPVAYERQDNVLDTPPVLLVEQLTNVLILLGEQRFLDVDGMLPQLLSHPAWGISTMDMWKLSLKAFKDRRLWLEVMLETPGRLKDLAEWLIVLGHLSQHEPLEIILDKMIGNEESQVANGEFDELDEPFKEGPPEEFTSPLRAYFFPSTGLNNNASDYLS
ncbi:hypothetical protein CYG49_04575, partial [Candidatus Saccharibacteria bacterium]